MLFKKILSFLFLAIFLFLPVLVKADGAPFPPPNKYVTETDQKAAIIFEDGTETMVLSVTFKGDPENFGWVIPIPTKPEVTKSSDELFTALKELTTPQTKTLSGVSELGFGPKTPQTTTGVQVIETKKIDIYDIKIITSENSEDLVEWLSGQDFQIPQAASTIFEDYTANNWYYVCVKIDLSKLTATSENQLKTGHATPLKFEFSSDKIIFPLKLTSVLTDYEKNSPEAKSDISGLTALPQVSFTLYVFADGKKTVPGFSAEYANWVKKDKIEDLAYEEGGKSWYQTKNGKLFLTKFYGMKKTSEMTDDLIFRSASDNESVGVVKSDSVWLNLIISIIVFALVFIIFVVSPLGLFFIIMSLIQFLSKSKTAQIVSWVLQSLALLFTTLIVLIISYIVVNNLNAQFAVESIGQSVSSTWSGIAAAIATIAFLVVEILIMIWQYRHQKKYHIEKSQPQEKADKIFKDKDKK